MSATRQQRWSKGALERVLEAKKGPEAGDYRTLCMKFAGLVHQAGLVQAIVFVQSRERAGKGFVDDLAQVLGEKELRKKAQEAKLDEYLALTNDVTQVAIWFRRFAQIELDSKKGSRP